jgi:xanthine/uracil permease
MQPNTSTAPVSKGLLWTGYVLSALPTLGLIASAVMKFVKPEGLPKEFARLGWPEHLATPLGIVELTCAILYAIPQTSVLGAILVTGYLGGAVATHVRIGDNFIPPVIFGVLVWLGLFLRDPRLRALLPLRS